MPGSRTPTTAQGSPARARLHCSNPLWRWHGSLPWGTSVLAGQTNIAGTTRSRRRRRRSGCIITTTESIRLSGRVNILGTVGLREGGAGRRRERVTLYPTAAPLETVKTQPGPRLGVVELDFVRNICAFCTVREMTRGERTRRPLQSHKVINATLLFSG